MLSINADAPCENHKLKLDGPRLLKSFRSFCEKGKKKKIPHSLQLGMHLSADLGLDSLDQVLHFTFESAKSLKKQTANRKFHRIRLNFLSVFTTHRLLRS